MNYRRYSMSSISFGGPLTPTVKKLIIACFVVFLLQLLAGYRLTYFLGLQPALVLDNFFFWQIVTYLFVHGGIGHLAFNMLGLFMFGCEMERYWGSERFLRYFLITGIGAGLCVFLIPSTYYVTTVGASGAIYGILLAYGLTFPDRTIYLYLLFPIPAKYFVIFTGAITFLVTLSGSNTGISNVAHLGGMVFGYLYLKQGLGRRRSRFSFRQYGKDWYYQWRLRRNRRKFEVYLNKKHRDQNPNKNETIH
ncbi:MAG: rhomboid family intramembrane serine protease [Acidobacteriota bacterium]